jgi:hypothetical protein
MENIVRRCQNCTQPLPEHARANRRYCDETCRRQAHGQPAVPVGRRCESCGKHLPEGSRKNKRFCDPACQKAGARRRSRPATSTTKSAAVRDLLAVVSAQLIQVETALGQARGRIRDRDREVAWLRAELAEARRASARALVGQANDAAGVRERLSVASGELSLLRRNWSATAEARVATVEVTGLRQQLATLQDKYGQLSARYQELSAAADLAATERQQLQRVVRQWDTLCKRLYKATGGQPAAAVDKDILATWTRFRQAVATGTGHRGRAPVAGHPAAQGAGQEVAR